LGWKVPQRFNMAQACARRWAADPAHAVQTAVIACGPEQPDTHHSYAELQAQANRLANALTALHAAATGKDRVWFDAADERNLLRADALAREMKLDAAIVGSGREYRRLAEVRAAARPVVVPFDFPRTPDVQTPRAVDAVPLRELEHWALAPTNLAELLHAGVPTAASTVRLKDVGGFAKAARRAMDCGTTEDELVAALTVNPARMLGISEVAGEVRALAGRSAEAARAELSKANPQGRLVTVAEVADTVLWLCGPGASAITGQAFA
jgi:hypothetical protein